MFSGEGSNSVPKRDLRKEEEAEKIEKEMRKLCLIGEEKRNPLLVEIVVRELETKGTLPGKHCPGLFFDLTQKNQRPSKLSLGPSPIPLSPDVISKSELDALNDAVKQAHTLLLLRQMMPKSQLTFWINVLFVHRAKCGVDQGSCYVAPQVLASLETCHRQGSWCVPGITQWFQAIQGAQRFSALRMS
jgi:hypothetical protein